MELFDALVAGDAWGWLFVACVFVGVGFVAGMHCSGQETRGFVP